MPSAKSKDLYACSPISGRKRDMGMKIKERGREGSSELEAIIRTLLRPGEPIEKGQELAKVLSKLPEGLRGQVLDFLAERADRARSIHTKLIYAYVALSLARAGLRDLRELADRERFRAWKRSLILAGLSEFTVRAYVSSVKTMLRWLLGELPAWLKAERSSTWELYRTGEHIKDKVLKPAELEALMAVARHSRDRAILAVLAETGLRIGELLGLRLRDVERLEDGSFRLMVKGKTGPRAVIVIEGAQALAEWLRERPAYGPMDPEAPLFTTIRAPYGPLSPHAFRTHLRNLARRAGLKRHIYPHVLRHTRMTELARVLTEHELKVVAGWSRDSRMATVYVHLSGRDAEMALRKAHELLRTQRPG